VTETGEDSYWLSGGLYAFENLVEDDFGEIPAATRY
jgi:hypothetical protein